MATINLGAIKFNWKGAYNNSTAYTVDDVVSDSGNSYVCILASTGNAVSNATYWNLMAQAGTNGTNGTDVGTIITTEGDLLYRDGSGLQRLAKPASDKMLQNTSGGVLSWESVSSDMVKLSTYTVSGTPSTFDWDITFDDSTYGSYVIKGLLAGDAQSVAKWRIRQAGSTKSDAEYDKMMDYSYRTVGSAGSASWGGNSGQTDSQFLDWNVETNRFLNFEMRFNLMENSTFYKPIQHSAVGDRQSGSPDYIYSDHSGSTTYLGNTSAITGFHFFLSTGNYKVPTTLTCYGFKK